MSNQYAIQDQNRFPGLLVHSGTANSATTIRATGQTSGAGNVHVYSGTVSLAQGDNPGFDAFGRFRVSDPVTLFDSKNIFNDDGLATTVENQPLFYDNAQTSGSSTTTSYDANRSCQILSVASGTAGTRVRQTKMRFNYQPGKSQLVMMTFNLQGTATGLTKREGIFDENNGLYLETSGGTVSLVTRTKTSGTVTNNGVTQANWNIDPMDGSGPSGVTLNWTKAQILWIDYEWLGVGRSRIGFVVDGLVYYAHEFLNANSLASVYMQTPNLPLRSEISNAGSGTANLTMEQICSTVISEGGSQDLGAIRYASTGGAHLDADTENTIYALIGIRLKTEYIGASVKLLNAALQIQTASDKLEWMIKLNPTVAGTFTYSDQTNSAVQTALGAAANTVTGGIDIAGGFAESGGIASGAAGSDTRALDNAILLGSKIDNTVDSLVLCVRPIGGAIDVDVEGALSWREIL